MKQPEYLSHFPKMGQMPILDGKAVVQRMRKDARFAGIPVIALTAFAMRGDREKALEAGFDNYLSKPIATEDLKKLLHEMLGP
jgi:CheY-like chemotaxis protein